VGILAGHAAADRRIDFLCYVKLVGYPVITGLDQDDFWLNQPKIINLIAFKVIGQLYGFT